MVHKQALVTLELLRAPRDDRPVVGERVHFQVTLGLTGGRGFSGHIDRALPPERARLVDFLNAAEPFIPFLVEGKTVLVHRRHVITVHDLGNV